MSSSAATDDVEALDELLGEWFGASEGLDAPLLALDATMLELDALGDVEWSVSETKTPPAATNEDGVPAPFDTTIASAKPELHQPGPKPAATCHVGMNHNAETRKRRNPSRDRMRSELEYLRERTRELEAQLNGLQTLSGLNSAKPNGSADTGLWKSVADRQLDRRRRAESENEQLKATLSEFRMLARRLEHFLHKRPSRALLEPDSIRLVQAKKPRFGIGDERIVARFLSELDDAYARVNRVLADRNSPSWNERCYSVKTKAETDGRQVVFLEMTGSCFIPFDFPRTSRAAWASAEKRFRRTEYVMFDVNDRPGDTIATNFLIKYVGSDALADNVVAIRRYVTKDRMVWVWRSLTEGVDECKDMLTDETGWTVFEPVDASDAAPFARTSMQSCVHIVPVQRESREPYNSAPKELTSLATRLIESYTDDELAISSMVENLLLDEPLHFEGRSTQTASTSEKHH